MKSDLVSNRFIKNQQGMNIFILFEWIYFFNEFGQVYSIRLYLCRL